jgi:hypothetical protein
MHKNIKEKPEGKKLLRRLWDRWEEKMLKTLQFRDFNWILLGQNTVKLQGSVSSIMGLMVLQKVEDFLTS